MPHLTTDDGTTGRYLVGQLLAATAQRLTTLPSADVGAGLVQAP
jgi:hypothetical protein